MGIRRAVLVIALGFATVGWTPLFQQGFCTEGVRILPSAGGAGWRPGSTVSVALAPGFGDYESCVRTALGRWTNNEFVVTTDWTNANLKMYRIALPSGTGGDTPVDGRVFDQYGNLTKAVIRITNDTTLLCNCENITAVVLHEVGHTEGLGHPENASCGDSVMNGLTRNCDSHCIPEYPTWCDMNASADYSQPQCSCGGCYDPDPNGDCSRGYLDWFDGTCCHDYWSPLILDLSGDGIRFSDAANGVVFDLVGNGQFRRVAWPVGTDNGWLAYDRNGNGRIDDGSELFGTATPTEFGPAPNGFIALQDFDSSRDGVVDSQDTRFDGLRVWRDANRNGVTDTGELSSLASVGVRAVMLDYHSSAKRDRYGNAFRYRSRFLTDHTPRWRTIVDVFPVTQPLSGPTAAGQRSCGASSR